MRLPIALGVAVAALTVAAASAHSSSSRHVMVRHGGMSDINIDANEDGWITRAEASSAFERIFADLDSNDDGRLDGADHREISVHVEGPEVTVLEGGEGRRIRVITRNGEMDEEVEEEIEREVERAMEEAERAAERAEREAERAERHAERAAREAEQHAREAERHAEVALRHIDRDVIIIRRDGDDDVQVIAPAPPVPPVPPIPPAPHFMMLIANSEEADLNGDGALSLEEFRNQHLRFFDASDANGDGRVRFGRPPEPPQPPAPPAPPEPPRRR